ncbi:cytochrome P450 [Actinomycetospora sp. C-140]
MSVETPAYPMARQCPFDPPAELDAIREQDPVRRVRLWDGSTPWLVTRHDDVRAVLADPRLSSDATREGYPATSAGLATRRRAVPSFISMDDPEHARYRRMLIPEFTVRRVEALRPSIAAITDDLLDAMAAATQPVDLVEAFALPLPSLVICRMLGVPYDDHAYFQRLSHCLVSTRAAADDQLAAAVELKDYLAGLVTDREKDPPDDVLGRLAGQVVAGELTREEAGAMGMLLLVAGHETTANMIALGTLTLLRDPAQAALVRGGEEATVRTAVEELLRLLTVVHLGRRRVAVEDVELRGVTVRAGEGVIAAGEAANRDPETFDDPDRLDVHRAPNPHVAFGHGIHQCLGQQLARIELQVAYPALLRRFPDLRAAAPVDELSFRDDMAVYGLHALPVRW